MTSEVVIDLDRPGPRRESRPPRRRPRHLAAVVSGVAGVAVGVAGTLLWQHSSLAPTEDGPGKGGDLSVHALGEVIPAGVLKGGARLSGEVTVVNATGARARIESLGGTNGTVRVKAETTSAEWVEPSQTVRVPVAVTVYDCQAGTEATVPIALVFSVAEADQQTPAGPATTHNVVLDTATWQAGFTNACKISRQSSEGG
jgi:hypothetical protein